MNKLLFLFIFQLHSFNMSLHIKTSAVCEIPFSSFIIFIQFCAKVLSQLFFLIYIHFASKAVVSNSSPGLSEGLSGVFFGHWPLLHLFSVQFLFLTIFRGMLFCYLLIHSTLTYESFKHNSGTSLKE